MKLTQKITPFLAFASEAEEAATFYTSLLPDSEIVTTMPNPVAGTVISVEFRLAGTRFVALNVGESWGFTEGISFHISCDTQAEIDELWTQLTAGGTEGRCGWLKDRFGVSWQVVPAGLNEMLSDPDPARSQRVMHELIQMKKLDMESLRSVHEGTKDA